MACRQPQRETEYSDEACTGLRLIVNRQGRKRFLFRYTFLGRKRSIQLGEYGPIDVNSARMKIAEYKRQLADDIDPKQQRDEARAILNFYEFAEQHYMPYSKANKRSFRGDQSILDNHMYPMWQDRRLTEITKHDIQRFLDKMLEDHMPATVNRMLSLAHRMFKLTIEWNFAPQPFINPAAGVRKLKENNRRERYLTKEELDNFIAACDAEPSRTPTNALKLAVLSGMRIGEILSARWSNLEVVDGKGSLFLPHTKSGFSRTVVLNDAALKTILEQKPFRKKGNTFIFPGKMKGQHIHHPKKAFARIKASAGGLVDLRIHDLRHSFASMLINSGATLYETQHLLGHHNPQTTTRYAHLSTDRLREVTGQIALLVEVD
ncbi:site-specific integrase [Pseudoalteromonas apostichopi]|uniref:site-specific integrase n=1 Tax=Pseudoalteromonas apostichopi TaxID=3035452 RepID=UPI0033658DDE